MFKQQIKNSIYSKTWLFLDLVLAFVWLLFCSNEFLDYFVLLLPLARIWVSFLLFRKSKLSPYAIIFSLISFIMIFGVYGENEFQLSYPAQQFINVFLHFMGCQNKGKIDSLSFYACNDTFLIIAKIVIVLWMIIIPMVVYLIQWELGLLESKTIGWKKSVGVLLYLIGCSFFIIPVLQYELFYPDFLFFMMLALLSMPFVFKLGNIRDLLIKEEIMFFVVFVILCCCFMCGDVFSFCRYPVIILATTIFYCSYCWYYSYTISFVDLFFIVLGGTLFLFAEELTNMERILSLLLSLIVYFVPIFKFILKEKHIKSGFVALFITALVMPVFSLGYNPYAVLEGKRYEKCKDCAYSPNGLMYVCNYDAGTLEMGIRDRYGVILPIEYKSVKIADEDMPLFLVEKGGKWNVYNIWERELLFEVNYKWIMYEGEGVFSMERDSGEYEVYDYITGAFWGEN